MLKRKGLRSGYTTGACAAAAAKAAAMLVMHNDSKNSSELITDHSSLITEVEIPFPDGSRVSFPVHNCGVKFADGELRAWASIIKDAGDDPDVTNGAEIAAEVRLCGSFSPIHPFTHSPVLVIRGGRGVGVVTKPGLSVPVGEAAINPVPRRMIEEAVSEAISECGLRIADCGIVRGTINKPPSPAPSPSRGEGPNFSPPLRGGDEGEGDYPKLVVTISVPMGEELAKKTLNSRLGIVGGISILGTSGIVRPLSTEAWTASISASMDVARALSLDEVVVSAGRVSERAHMKRFHFPEESYVMMGDYLEFSLLDAKRHSFGKIHLCAQWAKMLKIALSTPQTHVRHGAINVRKAVELLNRLGIAVPREREFNTAREIFDSIRSTFGPDPSTVLKVCDTARTYAEGIAGGVPVIAHLVSYEGEIIASSE